MRFPNKIVQLDDDQGGGKKMEKNKDKEIQVEVIYTCTPEELSRRFTEACLEVLMQRKTVAA